MDVWSAVNDAFLSGDIANILKAAYIAEQHMEELSAEEKYLIINENGIPQC